MEEEMPKKKASVGDIVEIQTASGLAYIQYTHDGGGMGELVRVLPGLYPLRPTDFVALSSQKELYFVFYTLEYALRDHQAKIVSHQPVPVWAQPYPAMRWRGPSDENGRTIGWKIFNAANPLTLEEHRRTPMIHHLKPGQERISIDVLRPHAAMVKELGRQWTPERAEELRLKDIAEAKARRAMAQPAELSEQKMRHYLYFPKKSKAEKAAKRLRDLRYSVDVRMGADGENWLALATKGPLPAGEEMEGLRDKMEALAAELNGEYDGWEIALEPLHREDTAHDAIIH
jgi:hypothetical protein